MGRPKKFNREDVMERAIPVFWKNGYAETSLQDLEQATGVNKSGLYSEFEDKRDLFIQSLRHYYSTSLRREALMMEPRGWDNIELFLKLVQMRNGGQIGCFAVNSMRELAGLPPEALELVTANRARFQVLIEENVRAEETMIDAARLAEMVMTFFTGLCLEQNLHPSAESHERKVAEFMQVIRNL